MENRYIILLKGINVGGKNIIKMGEFKLKLEELGYSSVKTYIQSGNIIISSEESNFEVIESSISSMLYKDFCIETPVLIKDLDSFKRTIADNPFKELEVEPKLIHFIFLKNEISTESYSSIEEELNSIKSDSEKFQIGSDVIYLYAPDGIGRSKFILKVERVVNSIVTVRNLRTVSKIIDLT